MTVPPSPYGLAPAPAPPTLARHSGHVRSRSNHSPTHPSQKTCSHASLTGSSKRSCGGNAGRESPQGMKFTTRTRSYGDQCDNSRDRGEAPVSRARASETDPVERASESPHRGTAFTARTRSRGDYCSHTVRITHLANRAPVASLRDVRGGSPRAVAVVRARHRAPRRDRRDDALVSRARFKQEVAPRERAAERRPRREVREPNRRRRDAAIRQRRVLWGGVERRQLELKGVDGGD
eukprot:30780-Pelagococcus_subviridis.AAC.2